LSVLCLSSCFSDIFYSSFCDLCFQYSLHFHFPFFLISLLQLPGHPSIDLLWIN
jgi:hypothetical protein